MRRLQLSIVLLTALLFCQQELFAAAVNGRVSCGNKGVKGVVVSDGYTTAVTGKNGKYTLETDAKLGYIFISLPDGYSAPSENKVPAFFKRIGHEGGKVDFQLEKDPGQDDGIVLCLGDLHLAGIHNDRQEFRKFVDDINAFAAGHQEKKIYALTVGDMTWDIYWKSQNYNVYDFRKDMELFQGFSIFPAIGNHDHELEAKGEMHATAKYRDAIGPTYYSFNLGKCHYVVLDATDCRNDGTGKRAYKCRVNPAQMEWLRKDLSYIDKDRQVIVVSHIPLSFLKEGKDELLGCFTSFTKPVHFITAHLHSLHNTDHLKGPGPVKYYEHLIGCPAGSLWMTSFHTPGITICKDGAPAGYTVFYNHSGNLSWQFKSTGHPIDYQFRAYDGNCIHLDPTVYVPEASAENLEKFRAIAGEWMTPSDGNYIYINVWNKDPEWKIEVTENGHPLTVENISVHDPLHIISYPAKVLNTKEPVGKITQLTSKSNHFVRAKASSASSTIEIKVTDRFGNVYTRTMQRPQEFDLRHDVLKGDHCFGSYMPYEYIPQTYSPVPEGFTPFYISHFGRHGSRFHTSKTAFKRVAAKYEAAVAAGCLTDEGVEQKALFDTFYAHSVDHIGELTELGKKEHADIASRMSVSFPEVFAGNGFVYSVSSKVKRVRNSMTAFDKSLSSSYPGLRIEEHYGKGFQEYVSPMSDEYREYYKNEQWKDITNDFINTYDPSCVINYIFKDKSIFKDRKDEISFARALWTLATGTKAAECNVNLFKPFSDEDKYMLWQMRNLSQYFGKGPTSYKNGLTLSIAVPLLDDILHKADSVIRFGGRCADLRFGHGEGVMPLTGLMGIEGASSESSDPAAVAGLWQDWKVTCLAANIQIIFYRNAVGKVIVRTLLNERECYYPIASFSGPYYEWESLCRYLKSRRDKYIR